MNLSQIVSGAQAGCKFATPLLLNDSSSLGDSVMQYVYP